MILSRTEMAGDNEIFDNMPDYRHSKPSPVPHNIYQVVSYDGERPIMVSCKVKGAAPLRAAYGEDAAGEQFFCPTITRMVQARAVSELERAGDTEAAAVAVAFVLDENEPYLTGRDYLSDFQLSYKDEAGAIHISTPGLFHDFDSWTSWILPEKFEGQAYCHLATPAYLSALATGQMEPGTQMTTADDAPVTPQ